MTIASSDRHGRVLELISASVSGKFRKQKITHETQLRRDLGLDSIALLSIVFQFEQMFGVDFAKLNLSLDLTRLRTAGDVLAAADAIFARIEATRPPSTL